jgi:hypothetical protein
MGKHETGYVRSERDFYPTPAWVVTHGLLPHVLIDKLHIWEPATGSGRMAEALRAAGARVFCSEAFDDYGYPLDLLHDFTGPLPALGRQFDGIITNPPHTFAREFIETGLQYLGQHKSFLALLLPTDYDSGKTRAKYFRDCSLFAGRIVLTERITWYKNAQTKNAPKENHAWFIWSSRLDEVQPLTLYGPTREFYAAYPTARTRRPVLEAGITFAPISARKVPAAQPIQELPL